MKSFRNSLSLLHLISLRFALVASCLLILSGVLFSSAADADLEEDTTELVQKYPKWKHVLENPQAGIEDLLKKRKFGILTEIIKDVHENQFIGPLCHQLGKDPSNLGSRYLVQALIDTRDPEVFRALIYETFSRPGMERMQDLMIRTMDTAVQMGHPETLLAFSNAVFSRSYSVPLEEALIALIQKGHPRVLSDLSMLTYYWPHSVHWEKALKMLLGQLDSQGLTDIQQFSFSQDHWNRPQYAYLKKAAEIADPDQRRVFLNSQDSKEVLLQKHPQWRAALKNSEVVIDQLMKKRSMDTMVTILKEAPHNDFVVALCRKLGREPDHRETRRLIQKMIELKNPEILFSLTAYTFSQPGAESMQDLMKEAIETAAKIEDHGTFYGFIDNVFNSPRSTALEETARVFLENADSYPRMHMVQYALNQEQWKQPRYLYLREGAKIGDAAQRREFFKLPNSIGCLMPRVREILRSGQGAANDN